MRYKTLETHQADLRALQEQLKASISSKKPASLLHRTGFSNTTRDNNYRNNANASPPLDGIIRIDKDELYALVEPQVTMDALVTSTLLSGLIPPVIPEFKGITVGGAIMGAALESTSHREGQFNDQCLGYELLLGDGSLIWASQTEYEDLFHALPGSYGSLALLTLIKLRLEPAKPYVKVEYIPYNMETLLQSRNTCHFLEGILFTKESGRIIRGEPATEAPHDQIVRFARPSSKWYYQHVYQTKRSIEWIPLYDYLFRFDRGAFWMGVFLDHPLMLLPYLLFRKASFFVSHLKRLKSLLPRPMEHFPSWILRHLFGSHLDSGSLYKGMHQAGEKAFETLFFVQDFYLPEDKAASFLESAQEVLGIYPIWLCPMRPSRTDFLSPSFNTTPLVNIGLYGMPKDGLSVPKATQQMETLAAELGGRKMLYSQSYYTEPEFFKIYNRDLYQALRKKYFADRVFTDLYQKISS